MSFEIQFRLGSKDSDVEPDAEPLVVQPDGAGVFFDPRGQRYSGHFDGRRVIFSDGVVDYPGRWIQGTAATVLASGGLLRPGFRFTFMDHGLPPQRLHAVWIFEGILRDAIEGWKLAHFSISAADRFFNRNHPGSSIHLRTRGAFATGADSSHVVIPWMQAGGRTTGNIHVGEFNPLTGFGLGFVLHHLESKAR